MTLEQPDDDEVYCWKVHGTSDEFTGYYAEEEAKAVAKRIGGTCFAFPLYVKPQPPHKWVGLTESETIAAANNANTYIECVRMTSAKLKEKNI